MSIDMYVSASKSQAKSARAMTKQQVTGYEEAQRAIGDFTLNSPFLTGKSYDSSKAFFSAVLYPLTQGGILLSEAVEKAVTKFPEEYQARVDSGNLKQSVLEEKIRQAERLIGQAEEIRRMLESPLTPDMIKASQLAANLRLIESYSEVKRILEDKLDKLMTFNHNSPKIFEEIQALEEAIDKGLEQTKTAFNPSTETFTVPSKKELGWSNVIHEKWAVRADDEKERLKETIEKENLPTTKAEILRDYYWATNSNMYVNKKTGLPSPEVTSLYSFLVIEESKPQKNPQLEFFNEMLRTGKHPTTGVKITEAERKNARFMLYTIALQPAVGAWAASTLPQSTGVSKVIKVSKGGKNYSLDRNKKIGKATYKKAHGAKLDFSSNKFSGIEGMTKADILDGLPDGWKYTENNGFIHVRDSSGKVRMKIDPPDNVTKFDHVHLFDNNGNPIDINGNIVNRKSSDAHIPYKK